jgi:hypothetical protein
MVAINRSFTDSNGVDDIMATIPSLFAKTSMLWTSVIYVCMNKNIRKKILNINPLTIYLRVYKNSLVESTGVVFLF